MKVVNVMLGAGAGGLESVGFQYARLLAEAGHDSWMLCHRKSPYASALGKKVVPLTNASVANPLAHLGLALAIRRIRPDVVFCHGARTAQFYTRFLKVFLRLAFAEHQPHFIAVCHGSNGWRCRRFAKTIAVSEGIREELIEKWRLGPWCVTTIANCVVIPPLYSVVSRSSIRIFGFLGRLDPCKGLDVLLRALASCNGECKLIVAGAGPEELSLRKLSDALGLADRVEWLGWITDKADFFSKIDAFVMPSREEAFGISMLEALSYGKPVIVSDCPGPADFVSKAQCGLIVPRESTEALAKAIGRLVDHPELGAEMASKGRSVVERNYSEKALQDRLPQMVSPESWKVKLSVIVPVYNVERCLARCLDSILTAIREMEKSGVDGRREVEVICINDGSTDGSGKILDRYRSTFTAQQVAFIIITQLNAGQGAARNAGLSVATGDVVTFVDSDDFLFPCAIEHLVLAAEESGLPVVSSMAFARDKMPSGMPKFGWRLRPAGWMAGKKVQYSACGKLFRREILKKMSFPACVYEDFTFVTEVFGTIDRFAAIDAPLYVYCSNDVATTIRSCLTESKIVASFTVLYRVMEFFHNKGFSRFVRRQLSDGLSSTVGQVFKTWNCELSAVFLREYSRFKDNPDGKLVQLSLKARVRLWLIRWRFGKGNP